MRIRIALLSFLFLNVLLLPLPSFAQDNKFNSTNFSNQNFIKCGNLKISIPPYLPFEDIALGNEDYITWDTASCANDQLDLYIGKTEECIGQNACNIYTFKILKTSLKLVNIAMENIDNTVELDNGFTGIYKPSQCNSYCNEAELYVFKGSVFVMIGTNYAPDEKSSLSELIKSANSYIDLLAE